MSVTETSGTVIICFKEKLGKVRRSQQWCQEVLGCAYSLIEIPQRGPHLNQTHFGFEAVSVDLIGNRIVGFCKCFIVIG
jgi:hypothetical protein